MSFIDNPGVLDRFHSGLGGQVNRVFVRMLPELGHVDPQDPDILCHSFNLRL